jgi:magnesium transporter
VEPSTIDATLEAIRTALEANRVEEAIAALTDLHPVDRAEAFADLDDQDQAVILPQLDINDTADLLEELDDEEAADVAEMLSTPFLADILDAMEPDEAADVLGDLPPRLAADALSEMEESEDVIPLLVFPDETAGGLMTTHLLTLAPEITAAQIIEIMDTDVISAKTDLDQENVARLMIRYDLAAMPVVDDSGSLRGVITYDDLIDVVEDEATEDIYRLANVPDSDLSFDSPIGLSVRRRLPWLFLSGITALFASWVISQFESLIAQVALLAAFLSVVAGLGGNTATQTLAIIVRAIALDEIEPRDAWRTLTKEAVVGLFQGLFIGAAAAVGVYLWTGNEILGLVLGLALVGNMILATVIGTLVPLILRWLGADPALASTVLVTAVTDSVGFALFLGLASVFINYMR